MGESTSPRWKRRSYDYENVSMTLGPGAGGGGASMASDYRRSLHGPRQMSDLGTRSRSRSRVGGATTAVPSSDYESTYMRYQPPAAAAGGGGLTKTSDTGYMQATPSSARPMSGYIYGHSYGGGGGTVYHGSDALNLGASAHPAPPPYSAKDVSARIRRYQQPES